MSVFGFDPEELARFARRRPRVVNDGRPPSRWPWFLGGLVVVLIVVLASARSLLELRVNFLFFDSLQHTNVFWTPLSTQVTLFVLGFLGMAIVVGLNLPGWTAAGRALGSAGGRYTFRIGMVLLVLAGLASGAFLASQWQDVLLWVHGHSFGQSDPAFHTDYGFFLFTLPVIDIILGLLWGAVLLSLLGSFAMAMLCGFAASVPLDLPFAVKPGSGQDLKRGSRIAIRQGGVAVIAIFLLAAASAHFGVYHLATSQHDTFVGLDATQRNVVRPALGVLQWIAVVFAVMTAIPLAVRWRTAGAGGAAGWGGLIVVWLVIAGGAQGIPAAIYQATSVTPNAQTAQAPTISDFLTTSRTAWGLEDGKDVAVRQFGAVTAPTLQDLAADPGTLKNVRIQDYRELPDALAQIDRSRSYQSYPTITVDRYTAPDQSETEVMVGPREIKEDNLPSQTFVNKALNFTHGYGITAVSVNRVGAEGKPEILAGGQPLAKGAASDIPPDLYFNNDPKGDPRIYCGLETTQPVVVNTTQQEFDYPSSSGDAFTHAGTGMQGFSLSNGFDRLAASLTQFGGFDLFLTSALTPDSSALIHRQIADRISTLAPFVHVDGDPYVVADPTSHHLMYVVDAYVESTRFPESFQRDSDGVSYMRNGIKAVVDARTCATTLYAVDMNEPMTATYNDIYPGLLTPLDKMPMSLKAHLRYPEDLLQAQSDAYALVHVKDAGVFFNRSDFYRPAEELIDGSQQRAQAYYVEATLPGESKPQFVLLQTFSPASSGGGAAANNMTAWLAAKSDYTATNHPQLVAVPLNNATNVLGPLQFDNNINTDPAISQRLTLLGQNGSHVILGNVIVLPFNNQSFLYVRPLYVVASSAGGNTSFPQLQYVIVGKQDKVVMDTSFPAALQTLFATTEPIPGLGPQPTGPSASPTPQPSGSPTAPATSTTPVSSEVLRLVNDLLDHEAKAQAAFQSGDFATYGSEQAAIKKDTDSLRALLNKTS